MSSTREDTLLAAPRHSGNQGVHGNGRKPLPDLDLTALAPVFAAWNEGTQRAIRANRERASRERHLEAMSGW